MKQSTKNNIAAICTLSLMIAVFVIMGHSLGWGEFLAGCGIMVMVFSFMALAAWISSNTE